MCGVTGYYQPAGFSTIDAEQTVRKMSACLSHRGPDDEGAWLDGDAGIAMGHRRLAILDLSPAGQQPMISASGRYVVAFNGEIYNHLEIREKLALEDSPPEWRGYSDTETLLAAIDHWGIDSALKRAVGMFAIALWDRKKRTLTLARDRMGEKPLYYGWQNGSFLFGSELNALRAHSAFQSEIDRDVLAMYMCRGYIEAPYSIFKNIFKLLPGTYLQVSAHGRPGVLPVPKKYWSLLDVAERGLAQPFNGSDDEAITELESRLKNAVALQSVADVPLGAFLSGGVDSTTVVALMQEQSSGPVKTFTIGFNEENYNEAVHAKSVAQRLGTDHTELYITPREAMEVIPLLPRIYDEPFGDSSAIPTFLVSQLARKHVTVSLSGDSGDELFGGYKRYQRTTDIWDMISRLPRFSRSAMGFGLSAISQLSRSSEFGRKAKQLVSYLSARNVDECYQRHILQRQDVHDLVLGAGQLPPHASAPSFLVSDKNPYEAMMYTDGMGYLPDDILAKVDRAAMDVSLETRIPFLDQHVIEFAWSLPTRMKIREGEGKWLLKQVLRKYVPDSLMARPKMGFGVPVGRWMRGPLRDWAENLLCSEKLEQQGFLNPRLVRQEWLQHLNGVSMSGDKVWQVLMFQAWLSNIGEI